MAMLGLISFCLVFLLGSSAGGQAATADRLAPQGMREMRASEWHALIRSIADTARRNDMIAIGTMATLDLPGAGRLLGAAQGQREAMKPPFGQTADSVGRGEAAEASVKKTGALTGREGARSAAPEEKLLAASQEVDAPNGVQLAGGKLEEILRRALLAARRDLEAMRRVAEKQRQRAEALARDLTMVLEVVEELEAKAAGAMRSKAAALRARDAAEKTLAGERRALEEARHRLGALERDLAVARQSSKVPGPDADLAAAEKAAEVRARQTAEAAARRAGEELALEREKVKSLAQELDTVRREREAVVKDGGDPAVAPPAAILEPDADLAAAENAAAVRARQIAEAAARRAVEELALEREKVKSLARELDTVRGEREAAMKDGGDPAVAPPAAILEPDADLAAENAAAVRARQTAEAAARRAVEELALEREKVKSLARELDTVRREREAAVKEGRDHAVAPSAAALEPDADLAAAEKAAVVLDGQIAAAAARRAGEQLALEREKVKLLARELDTVRREREAAVEEGGDLAVAPSAAVLEPDADLAAAEKAAVLLAGQIAEAASKRAGEELALEREKVKSLARDLDTVRQERDAAKKQLTGILAAQQRASEDAGDRAGGRGRAAPRKEVEIRKTRTERRAARVERAPQPLPEALLPRRLLPGLW
ncbi:TolA protein [Sinorhizobium fredii CCBAU 25509]|nr:TolA protein [Sinorhizobium fredii CCBAU 25509]